MSWARPGSSTAPVPVPEAGRTSSRSTPMGISTSPTPHPKMWGPDLLGHTAPLPPARPAVDGTDVAEGVQPLGVTPELPALSVAVLGRPKGRGEATRGRTLRLSPAAPCRGGTRSGATRRQEQAEGRKQGRKGLPKRSLRGEQEGNGQQQTLHRIAPAQSETHPRASAGAGKGWGRGLRSPRVSNARTAPNGAFGTQASAERGPAEAGSPVVVQIPQPSPLRSAAAPTLPRAPMGSSEPQAPPQEPRCGYREPGAAGPDSASLKAWDSRRWGEQGQAAPLPLTPQHADSHGSPLEDSQTPRSCCTVWPWGGATGW